MKKLFMAMVVVVAIVFPGNASAQDLGVGVAGASGAGGFKRFAVGLTLELGLATVTGDGWTTIRGIDDDDKTPRFSFGGSGYFVFYFTHLLGVQAGIGFIGKGLRAKGETGNIDWVLREQVNYMEIPMALRLNVKYFQAAVGFALNFALTGKTVSKVNDDTNDHKWNDDDDDWDYVRRANIAPWIFLGAAIPVGPISIVPGITWSIHLVNDLDRDEITDDVPAIDEDDLGAHAMNIMFNVGAEFGF